MNSPWKKQWMTKTVASGGKEEHVWSISYLLMTVNPSADLQSIIPNLEKETGKIGLRLNSEKTKVRIIGEALMFPPLTIGHQTTEEVKCFTYLGCVVVNNGKVEADINSRIGKASWMFQRLLSIRSCQQLVSGPRSTFTTPSSPWLSLMPVKHGKWHQEFQKAQCGLAELFM